MNEDTNNPIEKEFIAIFKRSQSGQAYFEDDDYFDISFFTSCGSTYSFDELSNNYSNGYNIVIGFKEDGYTLQAGALSLKRTVNKLKPIEIANEIFNELIRHLNGTYGLIYTYNDAKLHSIEIAIIDNDTVGCVYGAELKSSRIPLRNPQMKIQKNHSTFPKSNIIAKTNTYRAFDINSAIPGDRNIPIKFNKYEVFINERRNELISKYDIKLNKYCFLIILILITTGLFGPGYVDKNMSTENNIVFTSYMELAAKHSWMQIGYILPPIALWACLGISKTHRWIKHIAISGLIVFLLVSDVVYGDPGVETPEPYTTLFFIGVITYLMTFLYIIFNFIIPYVIKIKKYFIKDSDFLVISPDILKSYELPHD